MITTKNLYSIFGITTALILVPALTLVLRSYQSEPASSIQETEHFQIIKNSIFSDTGHLQDDLCVQFKPDTKERDALFTAKKNIGDFLKRRLAGQATFPGQDAGLYHVNPKILPSQAISSRIQYDNLTRGEPEEFSICMSKKTVTLESVEVKVENNKNESSENLTSTIRFKTNVMFSPQLMRTIAGTPFFSSQIKQIVIGNSLLPNSQSRVIRGELSNGALSIVFNVTNGPTGMSIL